MLRGEDMDKPYHAINAPIIEFIVNRVGVEWVGWEVDSYHSQWCEWVW